MNKNTILFILLASLVLMSASILQNVFYPPVLEPAVAEFNTANEDNETQPATDAAQARDAKDEDTSTPQTLKPLGSDSVGDNDGNRPSKEGIQKPINSKDADSATPAVETTPSISDANPNAPTNQPAENPPVIDTTEKNQTEELLSIGSIAANSGFRYLVTVDRIGGSIRRIELNTRLPSGRYKYRETEQRGGYLGELDLFNTPRGPVAAVVGHGTPAFDAGIRAGDLIRSIDGEPIGSKEDFKNTLSQTIAGQTITLEIQSDSDATKPIPVLLTNKPMEMVRPEPDTIDKGWPSPNSFILTLRKKTQDQNWPELDANMVTGLWNVSSISQDSVEFTYKIPEDLLTAQGLKGPLNVIKRFTLPKISDEQLDNTSSKTFDILFDLEVENGASQEQSVTFQLDGPTGTPSEGWWYQNKIHGRQSAIGYIAGARDVISSSEAEPFKFFGGPEIVKNQLQDNPKYLRLFPMNEGPEYQEVKYVAVDTQYFNVTLKPAGTKPFFVYTGMAMTTGAAIPEDNGRLQKLVDCSFKLFSDNTPIAANGKYKQSFIIFSGPKEPVLLREYGLEDARTFGWFAWFSKPLCWLLKVFYTMTFQIGYGIPIILLTILVRSLMIPVSRKAAINAQMMQYLQPQIKEIADKYKDNMEKRSSAQRELFKKYNYNPFGGCFMMFFQLPIFIGLYRGLSVDIALRDQPLIPGIQWCSNLAAPDMFWYWGDWMPNFLGGETGWLGPYLNILPIITIFLFLAQQKLFTPPATDDQQIMAQKVMKFMMIFMGVLFFKVPSGLCLYFITSSIWGIAERKMLPKPKLDTDSLAADDAQGIGKKMPRRSVFGKPETSPTSFDNATHLEEKKRRAKERKRKLKQRGN